MTLKTENLVFAYGDRAVLDGIDFTAETGEVTVVLGRNGAGKSTLLKHFNGLLEPDAGRLVIDGSPITYDKSSLNELRARVGFVFQTPEDQLIAPTVRQDVAFGPKNMGALSETNIDAALAHVGLKGYDDRLCHSLSNGEKKRVALAGVLAMDPEYVVLDEPTAGLDGDGTGRIVSLIDSLSDRDITLVISTHHVGFAREVADTVVVLSDGQIAFQGDSIDRETAAEYGLRTYSFDDHTFEGTHGTTGEQLEHPQTTDD